jgi:hypothetical protein
MPKWEPILDETDRPHYQPENLAAAASEFLAALANDAFSAVVERALLRGARRSNAPGLPGQVARH